MRFLLVSPPNVIGRGGSRRVSVSVLQLSQYLQVASPFLLFTGPHQAAAALHTPLHAPAKPSLLPPPVPCHQKAAPFPTPPKGSQHFLLLQLGVKGCGQVSGQAGSRARTEADHHLQNYP